MLFRSSVFSILFPEWPGYGSCPAPAASQACGGQMSGLGSFRSSAADASFGRILDHPLTEPIGVPYVVLGRRIVLRRRPVEPFHGLGVILWHSPASLIQQSQIVLGRRIALNSSFAKLDCGLLVVLFDPLDAPETIVPTMRYYLIEHFHSLVELLVLRQC